MATLSTFIGLPVSISLGVASLTGAIASGIISALTKKYQKKLTKVTKLVNIATSAIAVFETSLSKALSNGKIDEFNMLQTFHLKVLNELTSIDCKMEAQNRNQFKKSLLEEINEIKKTLEQESNSLLFVLCRVLLKKWIKSTTNLVTCGRVRKPSRS